jgi:hypothetical protein
MGKHPWCLAEPEPPKKEWGKIFDYLRQTETTAPACQIADLYLERAKSFRRYTPFGPLFEMLKPKNLRASGCGPRS